MSTKDYVMLAELIGNGFAVAYRFGNETGRTEYYDSVYTPLVKSLEADNPLFDVTRFCFAAAKAEHAFLASAPFLFKCPDCDEGYEIDTKACNACGSDS